MEALQVIIDEDLALNAEKMGIIFREGLQEMMIRCPIIKEVRGKGLLNAIVIDSKEEDNTAWEICLKFKENGLLAKPTHGNKIRLAPPLVITEDQITESLSIIEKSLHQFAQKI